MYSTTATHKLATVQRLPITRAVRVECACGMEFDRFAREVSLDSAEVAAMAALDTHVNAAAILAENKTDRPTGPGQAVRSNLDGTLGVTCSRVRPNGLITVMFIGSDFDGPFPVADLTITTLTATK